MTKILTFGVSLNESSGTRTLVVTSTAGEVETITDDDAQFETALAAVAGSSSNEFSFEDFVDLVDVVGDSLVFSTDRIEVYRGRVTVDGKPVDNAVSRVIVGAVAAGESFEQIVKFYDLLLDNPSFSSREQLFGWLDTNPSVRIDVDGFVLGHKGVTANLTSSQSGTAVVNGVEMSGQIPYAVGDIVTMERSEVCDDPRKGCAPGLHVGTESYARGFGVRMSHVRFSPADVVSVPENETAKIRVCRFEVLSFEEPHFVPDEDDDYDEDDYSFDDDVDELDDEPDDPFYIRCVDMLTWMAANDGAYPRRKGYGAGSDGESSLCLWAASVRAKYRNDRLSAEQKNWAESIIPGWTWERSNHPGKSA